ncbi:hypothetical protein DPV05_22530 [Salmonella enterica]|nr:hypothetical protein [Salmonella enterica]EBK5871510.1 hypothetical protein [Salmonella enterica subsp. enterica serovar Amsterdam]ECC3746514.1 hypothetical protein [Salmonella enterica subsp. enterica]EAT9985481.1 hypothetical protein [Salmonella enterica]EBJ2243655.1 hypothetical protein [Salmonella enterica]
MNRACSVPEGARPRDGLSSGAASWTDDELARRLPEGRAQRVNPPLTAIFDTKSISYDAYLVLSCIKCSIKKLV